LSKDLAQQVSALATTRNPLRFLSGYAAGGPADQPGRLQAAGPSASVDEQGIVDRGPANQPGRLQAAGPSAGVDEQAVARLGPASAN
jgi:tripartite-type tricarboxylate transporter receptor subunit TctC